MKKPIISEDFQVLIKLIRIALGTESDHSIPRNVNWGEIMRLSFVHKVSTLVFDGLQKTSINIPEEIYSQWQKSIKEAGNSYNYYLQVLNTLCQIFIANGLTPIILKGYGLSLNYPVPSHRGSGDIDIYLIDKDGKPAAEQAVALIENTLNIKTKKVPHDYEFYFKGIEVELHYDTTNAYWDTTEEHYVVDTLTELLLHDPIPCPNINGALLPSATFNALYLMRHTFGHFYTSSGNFRQYIDWMLFIQKHHHEVDWTIVDEALTKSGMKDFSNAIIHFIDTQFGECAKLCPIYEQNQRTKDRVVNDIFNPVDRGTTALQHITYYYRNRWKNQFLKHENWVALTINSVVNSIKIRIKA